MNESEDQPGPEQDHQEDQPAPSEPVARVDDRAILDVAP